MKISSDKFGRVRGERSKKAGPPGEGFRLDKDGNYDMQNRRITRVDLGVKDSDAANMQQVHAIRQLAEMNNRMLLTEFPKRIPGILAEFLETHKKEVLVPLIKETKLETLEPKMTSVETQLKQLQTSIVEWEGVMKKITSDAKEELKSLSDVTRAFVYKVTTPGYQRSSKDQEDKLRASVSGKDKTWRHLYPEIEVTKSAPPKRKS